MLDHPNIPNYRTDESEDARKHVETAVEARQGFLGRPVLYVLIGGLVLAAIFIVATQIWNVSEPLPPEGAVSGEVVEPVPAPPAEDAAPPASAPVPAEPAPAPPPALDPAPAAPAAGN